MWKCEYFFFNEKKLKSSNVFLEIQMLYHIVPKHLEHQFMFKAVSCWVGHLGCKLDEFDHDISTFRKKGGFYGSKTKFLHSPPPSHFWELHVVLEWPTISRGGTYLYVFQKGFRNLFLSMDFVATRSPIYSWRR